MSNVSPHWRTEERQGTRWPCLMDITLHHPSAIHLFVKLTEEIARCGKVSSTPAETGGEEAPLFGFKFRNCPHEHEELLRLGLGRYLWTSTTRNQSSKRNRFCLFRVKRHPRARPVDRQPDSSACTALFFTTRSEFLLGGLPLWMGNNRLCEPSNKDKTYEIVPSLAPCVVSSSGCGGIYVIRCPP